MSRRHWTRSYGSIPLEIDADRHPSLNAVLEQAMRQFAAKPAFHAFGTTLTYADVDRMSCAFAAFLQNIAGVKAGDRVAVMLPNLLAFPIVAIAVWKIGAVLVNVNPLYTTRELEHQLNDAGVESIVVCNASAAATLAAIICNTGVKTVVTVDQDDCGGIGPALTDVDRAALRDAVSLSAAIARGEALRCDPADATGNDLLLLQYTGGTTGVSKGAALSHRNLIANIEQFKAFMTGALEPGAEVVVTAIPLYHIFALAVNFLTYFSIGAENWLVANPRNVDALFDVLGAARPTVLTGVNTLYATLASHPRMVTTDWSRLKLSAGGGAAVMRVVSERWEAATGQFIREGYGLSETSPVISFNPQFTAEFTGTTGLPVPSTDVKLLDDADHEAGIGECGEVCVKGPQVTAGYWNAPEANAKAFTSDGYFRTGDIGVFNEHGFLKIVDRKKDMIIVSGFNVYPNEIEAVAAAFAGVAECACIGVPDPKTGEAVELFVVRRAAMDVSETELIAHCRSALAPYKIPKAVRFVDALPKSTVGKILRRELHRMG